MTNIPRWAGRTSFAGGLLFIFVFAWVLILAGPDPDGPAEAIARFPEIEGVRIVENGLYLAALALWVPLYLALGRVGALGVVGLGVLAAGALPHAATSRLSDLYHAGAATDQERATLVLVWQGVQGIFDALLLAGLLLMGAAVVQVGLAMRADPAFGKAVGWTGLLLGGVMLASGIATLIESASQVAALGFFALIAFHLALGWKLGLQGSHRRDAIGQRLGDG